MPTRSNQRGRKHCTRSVFGLLFSLLTALSGCAPAVHYEKSPQWHGDRFENPADWSPVPRPGLRELMKWQLSHRPEPRPFRPKVVANDGAALRNNKDRFSITWIGHATTLLQAGGVNILTDPIFSNTVGGIVRNAPPGVALSSLPPIDVVVISHNHRDHLDASAIDQLDASVQYIVPLGLAAWFQARGRNRVIELDWWQSTVVSGRAGARAKVTMVPAQHWSRRGLSDENQSLWGGYVIDAGQTRVYFAGDTAWPAEFSEIGRRFPHIDYAILPIGAYAPRWFMRSQHIDPVEAAKAFRELGAKWLVPVHWGTFRLSDEPMDEPPRLLRRALGREGVSHLIPLSIGSTFFDCSTTNILFNPACVIGIGAHYWFRPAPPAPSRRKADVSLF